MNGYAIYTLIIDLFWLGKVAHANCNGIYFPIIVGGDNRAILTHDEICMLSGIEFPRKLDVFMEIFPDRSVLEDKPETVIFEVLSTNESVSSRFVENMLSAGDELEKRIA